MSGRASDRSSSTYRDWPPARISASWSMAHGIASDVSWLRQVDRFSISVSEGRRLLDDLCLSMLRLASRVRPRVARVRACGFPADRILRRLPNEPLRSILDPPSEY